MCVCNSRVNQKQSYKQPVVLVDKPLQVFGVPLSFDEILPLLLGTTIVRITIEDDFELDWSDSDQTHSKPCSKSSEADAT